MIKAPDISKKVLRKNLKPKPVLAQRNPIDLVKWFAFVVTLLGIQAWIAGEAYYSGYWSVLGLDGPFSPLSLQRTAFIGFLGVFTNWEVAAIVIGAMGLYVVFLAVGWEGEYNRGRPRWIIKIRGWLRKFTFDKSTGIFGGAIILMGVAFLCIALVLGLWMAAAYSAGANSIQTQICEMRKGKSVMTTAKLFDGTVISGLLMDRSDKFTAIMDAKSVQVLTVGDKQQLLYTIQIPKVKCTL